MNTLNIKLIIFLISIVNITYTDTALASVKTGLDGKVTSVRALPDGKILLGGDFESIEALLARNIVKIDTNGSIINYKLGNELAKLGALGNANKSLLQSDGKLIVVFGPRPEYNGKSQIVRLLPDGQIDPSFNWKNTFDYRVRSIAQRKDGRLLLAFSNYGKQPNPTMVQLNIDGSIDSEFNANLSGIINSIVIENKSGTIYIGGEFRVDDKNVHLARLNSFGQIDKRFVPKYFFSESSVAELRLRSDDKIVALTRSSYGGRIVLLDSLGRTDETFKPILLDGAKTFTLGGNNEIYVSGDLADIKGGIRKYKQNGELDLTFNTGVNS